MTCAASVACLRHLGHGELKLQERPWKEFMYICVDSDLVINRACCRAQTMREGIPAEGVVGSIDDAARMSLMGRFETGSTAGFCIAVRSLLALTSVIMPSPTASHTVMYQGTMVSWVIAAMRKAASSSGPTAGHRYFEFK